MQSERLSSQSQQIINEFYTSGTSYLDGEDAIKKYYDKSRRVSRGLFISNTGIEINADVNAAYQIMKKAGGATIPIKVFESITILKVA